MASFEIGDVVQLKSGGPSMCVGDTRGSDISCIYFNTIKGEMVRETFHIQQLRTVSGSPQPVGSSFTTRG